MLGRAPNFKYFDVYKSCLTGYISDKVTMGCKVSLKMSDLFLFDVVRFEISFLVNLSQNTIFTEYIKHIISKVLFLLTRTQYIPISKAWILNPQYFLFVHNMFQNTADYVFFCKIKGYGHIMYTYTFHCTVVDLSTRRAFLNIVQPH